MISKRKPLLSISVLISSIITIILTQSIAIVDSQLCWCNMDRESSSESKCDSINNPSVEPPATGTCENEHGCVYDYMQTGTQLYCARTDVGYVSEYAILNGALYNVRHQCTEHLCKPAYLLSVLDCPWLMAPSDTRTQRQLRCNCNQGLRCLDGQCSYEQEKVPDDMTPACRYWSVDKWQTPIIDCWFTSQPYDRQVYKDEHTVYVMCRDANFCNEEAAVLETLSSDNHCPLFAVQAFHERLAKLNPKLHGSPPKVDETGKTIEYVDMDMPGAGKDIKETVDIRNGTKKNNDTFEPMDTNQTSIMSNITNMVNEILTTDKTLIDRLTTVSLTKTTPKANGLSQSERTTARKSEPPETTPTSKTTLNEQSPKRVTQSVTHPNWSEHSVQVEPDSADIYAHPDESSILDGRISIWPPNKILALTLSFVIIVAVFLLAVSVYVCSMI